MRPQASHGWCCFDVTLSVLLEKYNLMHHAITFVKDESSNLTFMTTTLGSIVDCHPLKL